MRRGDSFRLVTGERYTIAEITETAVWVVSMSGGVSHFDINEVEFLIKYWEEGADK